MKCSHLSSISLSTLTPNNFMTAALGSLITGKQREAALETSCCPLRYFFKAVDAFKPSKPDENCENHWRSEQQPPVICSSEVTRDESVPGNGKQSMAPICKRGEGGSCQPASLHLPWNQVSRNAAVQLEAPRSYSSRRAVWVPADLSRSACKHQ